jgi:penicillin-binding protein 2
LLEVAKTELEGKKGAVVVTTKDGQVLALYSAPSFDPITLSGNDKKENLPFFNRFMGGAFHPGSPFKIVTATAAIEDQKIAADYTFVDEGVIRVKDYSYNNWYFTQYGKTEGTIGVSKGLARSTDTLFYKLGELVGPTRLSYWALQFGYGAVTGIDLPGEVAGLIPNPEWKIKTKGEPWYLGNSYHMAIGQGDVAATPIQVNAMMATIANNGVWCNPRVNVKTEKKCKDLKLSQVTKDEITKGLIDACHPGGTGVAFFTYPFAVACKTGTAETGIEDDTHAWFTVYGPTDDPQIVVTVLVENGGGGSTVAAPIAKKVFDAWFVSQMP